MSWSMHLLQRCRLLTSTRSFGTSAAALSPASNEVATGANVYQAGTDPPLKPDDEYPEWLWRLLDKPKNARQLEQLAEDSGGYEHMPPADYARLVKLNRKAAIKEHNAANRKR